MKLNESLRFHLRRIFYMTEACMSRINVCNWDYSTHNPLVGSSTIKIRLGPFDGSRDFISTRWSVESQSFIGVVGKTNFHLVCCFRVLPSSYLIREPCLIPLVDAIIVCGIIATLAFFWNSSQISNIEHVQCGVALQMDGIIVIISSEGSRSKEWEGFVEE